MSDIKTETLTSHSIILESKNSNHKKSKIDLNILLIPSASIIPSEMQDKFGKIPTCLYPLDNLAILEHIYNKFYSFVDKIVVAAYHEYELILNYISLKRLNIDVVVVDRYGDLGYTIYSSLSALYNQNYRVSRLHINFGDTLTSNIPVNFEDTIYYDRIYLDSLWTYYTEERGIITSISDKDDECRGSVDRIGNVFVGEFTISSTETFYKILKDCIENARNIDSFYFAIMSYSQIHPFLFNIVEKWIDVGHNINSLKAKSDVASRDFNTISIDENRGILRKTSTDKVKFVNEINWYLSLPSNLKYLSPRIYDYSMDLSSPFVSMEYYGYSTLHELLIYSKLPLSVWKRIFEQLYFIISDMQQSTITTQYTTESLVNDMVDMYIEKPINRLNVLRNNLQFEAFFNSEITINGTTYPSLSKLQNVLPRIIRKKVIENSSALFSIIHGDLCFTNIIVGTGHNFIRLIDPRGSFGTVGIYGDLRYDIAKLLHSTEGGYDYIIEDMVAVDVVGTSINYNEIIVNVDALSMLLKIFEKYLGDVSIIRIIEATLFLSMIPLHNESLSHQYVMLARGVELFWNEITDNDLSEVMISVNPRVQDD